VCFLPGAFGQGTANTKTTGAAHTVLNYEPSSFLALAFTSGNELYHGDDHKDGHCGYDSYDDHKDGKGSKCAAVPEGGTPLTYLLLAGFTCLGAMVLRSRRRMSLPESH